MKICLNCHRRFDSTDWQCPQCEFSPGILGGHYLFAPDVAHQNEGFPHNAFDDLVKVEADSFWFRSRNKLIIWALGKYFPRANNFLEIGCGTGFVLRGIQQSLPRLSLAGAELYSSALSYTSQRVPQAQLFQMDARNIPFEDEFDVMGAFDVLEHIDQDELALNQIFRATKAGGGLLLTVPQHPFLWSRVDEYSAHVRRYTARELASKVERAGFRITRITSYVSLLLPLMIVSRLKDRFSSRAFDPQTEYRMSQTTDNFLEKIQDIERYLITSGVSPSGGGSLLLIGHKL